MHVLLTHVLLMHGLRLAPNGRRGQLPPSGNPFAYPFQVSF